MRLRRKQFPQSGSLGQAGVLRSRAARLGLILGGVLVGLAVACLIAANIRLISLEYDWGRELPPANPAAGPGSFDAVPSYEAESFRLVFWRMSVSLVHGTYTSFASERPCTLADPSVPWPEEAATMAAWRRTWQSRTGWSTTAGDPVTEGFDRDPLDFVTLQGLTRWRLGPLWCKGYLRQGEEGVVLHVPYLLIAAIGLLLATPAILGHFRRRPGACPRCGYDWKGLEACPECGGSRAESEPSSSVKSG